MVRRVIQTLQNPALLQPTGPNMHYATHNDTDIDIFGTHLQGYIDCSYQQLTTLFGEPDPTTSWKVNWEWIIKFDDGTVATVYDWKSGSRLRDIDGNRDTAIVQWNIGGHNRKALDYLYNTINTDTA